MAVNKTLLRQYVFERGATNSPATYKEVASDLGFHWRDRTLNRVLGELSQESWDQYGILISAMIGHTPMTKHGQILPGDGFNVISREVAGIEITDYPKYRQKIQQVLNQGQ